MGVLRFLILLIGLLGTVPSLGAERLSNGFTQHPEAFFRAGFWYDPADPGWGLDLHMSGSSMVGTWATYDEVGHPVWYLGVAESQGDVWIMPLTHYVRTAEGLAGERVGTLELRFETGYQASMDWQLGERSGRYDIRPLVVSDAPIAEDRTGFWYEVDNPGYGLSISTQADWVLSVFLFYNDAGQPRWIWADNIDSEVSERLNALSFTGPCPGCDARPVDGQPAGVLDLRFRAENHAELDTDLRVAVADEQFQWVTRDRVINLLSDRPSGREQPFRLAAFTNEDTLLAYLRTGLADPGPYHYHEGDAVFSPEPATQETSSTNLQETGVDEADVIKTDGSFIYALDQNWGSPTRIRVLQMAGGGELHEVAAIDLDEDQFVDGLYLVTDRPGGRPDLLLATFGSQAYYAFDAWFAPTIWIDTRSGFKAYDVSDPASPSLRADVAFDGGGVETRRIGETLYFVSRFQPYHSEVAAAPSGQRAILAGELRLDELLPRVEVNGRGSVLVDSDTALLPPQPPGFRYPDLLTVSAFDLANLDAFPNTISMAGLAETVYVSQHNLFVATSRYASSIDPGFDVLTHPDRLFTDIHQFALNDGVPAYLGSGVVEGFVSWGGTGPSFSFSEHREHLRVVTSGRFEHGEHRVSVLELAGTNREALEVRGFAPNDRHPEALGKPGEQLYGLRFLGDRLYAVSFKNIDPLYVVDLARPSDPRILGELEVTGFSDYLHPLPGHLLLGFGKEAVPASSPGDGNFAWYQGLQLSLFDVSDPLAPALVRRIDIGRRGSSSSLLYDHHALAYLPPDPADSRPARIAIPVVVHDAKEPGEISNDPTRFYDWRATGLAMFDVFGLDGTAADLVLADLLVTHTAEANPEHDYYADSDATAGRSVITADSAYFYLRGDLYSAAWGEGDTADGPF